VTHGSLPDVPKAGVPTKRSIKPRDAGGVPFVEALTVPGTVHGRAGYLPCRDSPSRGTFNQRPQMPPRWGRFFGHRSSRNRQPFPGSFLKRREHPHVPLAKIDPTSVSILPVHRLGAQCGGVGGGTRCHRKARARVAARYGVPSRREQRTNSLHGYCTPMHAISCFVLRNYTDTFVLVPSTIAVSY
jgi:hypothetical protein